MIENTAKQERVITNLRWSLEVFVEGPSCAKNATLKLDGGAGNVKAPADLGAAPSVVSHTGGSLMGMKIEHSRSTANRQSTTD
jgi:hypothetical protein